MTYYITDNWTLFEMASSLLKSKFRVEIMLVLVKPYMDDKNYDRNLWIIDWPRASKFYPPVTPSKIKYGVFRSSPILLDPKLRHLDPKLRDLIQYSPWNITRT